MDENYYPAEDCPSQDMPPDLLKTIHAVTIGLIAASPGMLGDAVMAALRTIGETVGVNRAALWQNIHQDSKCYCRRICFWQDRQAENRTVNFLDYDSIPSWKKSLLSGKATGGAVRGLPGKEKIIWESQRIGFIFAVPISVQGQIWGFLEVSGQHEKTCCTAQQEQFLRSGGAVIVSAVLRNQLNASLELAKKNAVNNIQVKNKVIGRMAKTIEKNLNALNGTLETPRQGTANTAAMLNTANQLLERLSLAVDDLVEASLVDSGTLDYLSGFNNLEKFLECMICATIDDMCPESRAVSHPVLSLATAGQGVAGFNIIGGNAPNELDGLYSQLSAYLDKKII